MGLVFILLKISLGRPQGGWERSTALHKGACAMLWTHEPSVVMIISLPRRLASEKHQLLTFRAGKIHDLFFFFLIIVLWWLSANLTSLWFLLALQILVFRSNLLTTTCLLPQEHFFFSFCLHWAQGKPTILILTTSSCILEAHRTLDFLHTARKQRAGVLSLVFPFLNTPCDCSRVIFRPFVEGNSL